MLEAGGINTFYGGAHILEDLSLRLGENEVVALLGRNGAGKSTTIKTLMGIARPRTGYIRYEGAEIQNRPPHYICGLGVGYVPEERRIFSKLTVQENLDVGRRGPRAGLPEWTPEKLFELFPNLKERRRQAGGRLSGGEQQMLTIARTLMGNPRVVLLDEPSEGISPLIVEQMAAVINELKRQGLSLIISEQNLHFAKMVSDRAYVIEKGAIRYEGTLAELEARPEVRKKYLAV